MGNIFAPQRMNRYSYCLNDPVNYIDPDGGDPVPIINPGWPAGADDVSEDARRNLAEANDFALRASAQRKKPTTGRAARAKARIPMSNETPGYRSQLEAYMDTKTGCQGFFGDRWSSLKDDAGQLYFYDMTKDENKGLSVNDIFPGIDLTFEGYMDLEQNQGASEIVISGQRGRRLSISRYVLLTGRFYDPTVVTDQGASLFHALLHYNYQLSDTDLASRLNLAPIEGYNNSQLISNFLQKDCDKSLLKPQ